MRALSPGQIVLLAHSLSLAPEIQLLEKSNLADLEHVDTLVFANDEVMRTIAKKYFPHAHIVYDRVFLRWDKMSAVTSFPVSPDVEISEEEFAKKFIRLAKKEAEKSSDWWRQIGAIVIKDGQVLFSAFNQHFPTENSIYIEGDPRANFDAGERQDIYTSIHAEARVIAEAARKGISIEGASVFVTTFPCSNCAVQLAEAGIKEIFFSAGYSNLNAEKNLRNAGVRMIRVKTKEEPS
jgi:dCMP deaminase